MTKTLREPSLRSLGLGDVLDLFRQARLPVETEELVDRVFGDGKSRGSIVISGVNGMVGAGKAMQLGSRLHRHGVRIVGLDFPNAPDGIGKQYPGLVSAFGREEADAIMANIVRLTYDGRNLPGELRELRPRFLLEAIPEILSVKKAHYEIFRTAFPEIEIRSVTSGFPSSVLGVGIAHPSFPHQINKIWEVVEPKPSPITQLLWSLGMIPIPVGDHWSFVLDVLFCGLTHASARYHETSNMPFWKVDKFVRKYVGPNPFRAHDAIGAKGANFLTWSCLHHLAETYGDIFRPTTSLEEHKESGIDWYPPNHFRPLVDWKVSGDEIEDLKCQVIGSLFQMASLLVHENRATLPHINSIGELCAQFRRGILAMIRDVGPEEARRLVTCYHKVHPQAAEQSWFPDAFDEINDPGWQQLYVNAEHDGSVGILTIGRESYNSDVDQELNRAIDWLLGEGIDSVILTGDFHLATQLVGADTSEFYPALERSDEGARIAEGWSNTARRLSNDFRRSVGFIHGKRCLGGMLELMVHCHYLVALDDVQLGMPEVTLPVVPGMEGCHWPFRKASSEDYPKLLNLLLTGRSVPARETVGWLVDFAGPIRPSLQKAWQLATHGDHGLKGRDFVSEPLSDVIRAIPSIPEEGNSATQAARKAILDCIHASCGVAVSDALAIQAKHSAGFMTSSVCMAGRIGADYKKTVLV